ncbi:thymidine kinase [Candidatus Phytoplasma luffae]|uniref:Thymidine kinase n=1 Tax=Loofah witches'-broom phytoplasma TaxID=35773 RepID=A0A975FJN9_LOWBP|nr:thymidine kinase [Candidatus Phytoplasma luffae]QTX03224.1 thymidine kinase [Candidatus Phytoplasma luffae]
MILDKEGFIEIICGPMFSGKTTKLIDKINLVQSLGVKFLVFKSKIDDRYSEKDELVSHDSKTFPSILINKSEEILNFINSDIDVLFIDEVQFLDNGIEKILNDLSYQGFHIFLSGLELDFCGRPFGSMSYLLSIADEVIKLKSSCVVCGKEASRTQRIIDQKIPKKEEPIIIIGGKYSKHSYHEPRCRKCHKFLD